jgi:hypothetical protein
MVAAASAVFGCVVVRNDKVLPPCKICTFLNCMAVDVSLPAVKVWVIRPKEAGARLTKCGTL